MKYFLNNRKQSQGFTLFGLLLYIALAATVLTVLGELTMGVLILSARADRDRSNVYTLLFLRAKLANELEYAESIVSPILGNSSTTLTFVRGGKTITYTTADGRLWRTEDSSEPVVLTPEDVVVVESMFEIIDATSLHSPVRWTVQTGAYDPLKAGVVLPHATTTVIWYPYANT